MDHAQFLKQFCILPVEPLFTCNLFQPYKRQITAASVGTVCFAYYKLNYAVTSLEWFSRHCSSHTIGSACLLCCWLHWLFFSLSGSFCSETDVCSTNSNSSKCDCSERLCTQHAEQANCPCLVSFHVFTIVVASRSSEDVDELCFGGLICCCWICAWGL